MNTQRSILVTGSAGAIGRAVCRELNTRGHHVRGLDCRPTPDMGDAIVGDILEPAEIAAAMDGIDTVIHLAATRDDADFMTKLLPNNIIGLYRVLDGAREANIKNMILTSSTQVNMGGDTPLPYTTDMLLTPNNWYAAAKVLLEAAGRVYSERDGMNVIVVRPGACPLNAQELPAFEANPVTHDLYLSHGDAGRFYACAVEAVENIRFTIVYATSNPRQSIVADLGPAREQLGYEPQDTWPDGTELLE